MKVHYSMNVESLWNVVKRAFYGINRKWLGWCPIFVSFVTVDFKQADREGDNKEAKKTWENGVDWTNDAQDKLMVITASGYWKLEKQSSWERSVCKSLIMYLKKAIRPESVGKAIGTIRTGGREFFEDILLVFVVCLFLSLRVLGSMCGAAFYKWLCIR